MPNLPPVTAWSYSRYSDYRQCPAKFMYKHLKRLPDPGNAAMQRGNDIHKLAEDYVRAKLSEKVPVELKGVAKELKFLRDNYAVTEQQWGFQSTWEWTGRPDWFGADVWFRAKTDVYLMYDDNELLLGDWKTGKKYLANEEQVELFALAGYRRFPHATQVDTRLWYTDQPPNDNEIQRVYTPKELEAIQRDWTKRVIPMFKDKRFAPTPNQWCGRCAFSKENGGPCKF